MLNVSGFDRHDMNKVQFTGGEDYGMVEDPSLFTLANMTKTRPEASMMPMRNDSPPRPSGGGLLGDVHEGGGDEYSDTYEDAPAGAYQDPAPAYTAVNEDMIEQARRVQEAKLDALAKLHRLCDRHKRPVPSLTMRDTLEDIQLQLETMKRQVETEHSIAMQRRLLMTTVSTMEWLNGTYDPVGMDLDGWSESIMRDLDEYDNVFEKLHDKYKDRVACPPEIQLMLMLGGSAFMFSMTKTMSKAQAAPTIPAPPVHLPTAPIAAPAPAAAGPAVNTSYVMRGPLTQANLQRMAPPPVADPQAQASPLRVPPTVPVPAPPSPTVYSEMTDLSVDGPVDGEAKTIALTVKGKGKKGGKGAKASPGVALSL